MQSHLVYHYTSLRYLKLWKPFIKRLSTHLEALKGDKILIFGGSACACLETAFLKKFKTILIYDRDPLAPIMFRAHHGVGLQPKYYIEDAFSYDGKRLNAKRTLDILEQHDPESVLFSNVIGQLPLYYKKFFKEQDYIEWSEDMLRGLEGYTWISFHDIFSFQPKKKYVDTFLIEKDMKIMDVYKKDSFPVRISDHLTLDEKWPRPSLALEWNLTPKSTHYVEVTGSHI